MRSTVVGHLVEFTQTFQPKSSKLMGMREYTKCPCLYSLMHEENWKKTPRKIKVDDSARMSWPKSTTTKGLKKLCRSFHLN